MSQVKRSLERHEGLLDSINHYIEDELDNDKGEAQKLVEDIEWSIDNYFGVLENGTSYILGGMSDKDILVEVYRRLKDAVNDRAIYRRSDITSFIEQEWQQRDDTPSISELSNPNTQKVVDSVKPIETKSLDERHCKLVIQEDGTVTEIERLR